MKRFFCFIAITLIVVNIQPITAQVIHIGETFSSDTIFQSFPDDRTAYSIHLYGSIQLYSDSSLVRVVLVDTYGSHFLLYEAYPLITDTNAFSITSGCDETCFLDGIIPDSIRVDIISAFCVIDSIKLDTNFISNAAEKQAQVKWINDSIKIAVMNHCISEEHMYWRAGRTRLSANAYSEKELIFGKKHMLYGYDYYLGGIFQSPFLQVQPSSPSVFPEQFNWQDRHDANVDTSFYYDGGDNGASLEQRSGWLTKPKSQTPCQSCYAFSAVALVEAYANLFFNNNTFNPDPGVRHHIDLNLSELKAMRCKQSPFSCTSLGNPQSILYYIQNKYISDENCFPYELAPNNPPCSDTCQNPVELVKISQYNSLSTKTAEYLKEMLIKFGPISCFIYDYPVQNKNHVMLLVGYKIAKEGDIVYHGTGPNDPPIILDSQCGFLDGITWYFKDSGQGQFIPHGLNLNKLDLNESNYLTGDIFRYRSNTETTILCSDEDGDGYYWWGVHRYTNGNQVNPLLCNCPPGVKGDEEDCNDNDPTAGPYVLDPNDPQPLYSCSPVDCETKEGKIDILGDNVWPIEGGDLHIDSNIIIHTNAKLTINCQVFFTPGVKIIVQPGGTLKLEGTPDYPARLTSGCGEFWGGIEVQGDPSLPQRLEYQGMVIINSGIIENATTGIKTINAGVLPDGGGIPLEEGTPSGGIIRATGATFRNNITGVDFLPYRDNASTSNKSFFRGCTFETTKELFDEHLPSYLLKLSGIDTLVIKGSRFRNTRKKTIQPNHRGYGIYSYNAELKLDTIYKTQPVIDEIPCKFDSLNYGIYTMASNLGMSSLDAYNCVFKDNARGLYASGFTLVNPFEVRNSRFYYNDEMTSNPVYLLYLNNCTGFKVHQNTFMGTTSVINDQYGVIVNNALVDNNYIYHNTFQRLTYGIQGLNINRNNNAYIDGGVPIFIPTGLRFICNKFEDVGCNSDFLINANLQYPPVQLGIACNQRNASNISDPTQEPAGNIFSTSHDNNDPYDNLWDINISQSVGDILYTYHISSDPPGLRLFPEFVSNPDKVNYDGKVLTYSEDASCPDTFFPEGDITEFRSEINFANQKIDSLINLLQYLVDEGSTDSLKSMVENSTLEQSYEVYQDLMSASPYLSDSVVKSSIEKEEILPNAMIRDIMVANPQSAKSEELLTALDERADPMPDSLWADILQGMNIVGAMERLVGELSGCMQHRDLYFNALAELFMNDTINPRAQDSLISLFTGDSRIDSRYLLLQYYLTKHDYDQATSIVQAIPSQYDLTEIQSAIHQRVVNLLTVLPLLFTDSLGYLVPDSLQRILLEQIAGTDCDFPGAWARNILIASGLMNYEEPIVNESTLKSSRKDKYHWKSSRSIKSDLKVFPNPAKDYLVIEYQKESDDDQLQIVILDMQGRRIGLYQLDKNTDQKIIPTTGMKTGSYMIQLYVNGVHKKSNKIMVIH